MKTNTVHRDSFVCLYCCLLQGLSYHLNWFRISWFVIFRQWHFLYNSKCHKMPSSDQVWWLIGHDRGLICKTWGTETPRSQKMVPYRHNNPASALCNSVECHHRPTANSLIMMTTKQWGIATRSLQWSHGRTRRKDCHKIYNIHTTSVILHKHWMLQNR